MNRFLRRIRAIAHKEVLHMLRDIRVVYMALGLPLVMLVLFGFGISTDSDHVSMAVVDQDGTRASRRLIEAFFAGDAFDLKARLASPDEAERLFRKGQAKAALVIPQGYQRDLNRGARAQAQLLVDGSDSSTATIAIGNAAGIVGALTSAGTPSVKGALSSEPAVRTRFNRP